MIELGRNGFAVFAQSALYRTEPIGPVRQPKFVNAVVGAHASLAPGAMLRALKRLERLAGRRKGTHWGPRPLDLDILDFGGRIVGRPTRRARPPLALPHPEMHRRPFVLLPLASIAPAWRHPRFGVGAANLLLRGLAAKRGERAACLAGVFMSSPAQRGRHRRIIGGAP
jgi:2-amino-4-hydroxy-6-hydroxymethyldihydropteridine diphosphokinase